MFLLVEDEPNDAYLMQANFKDASHNLRLVTVSDGLEAMQYLKGEGRFADRAQYPMPDVILLDLKMPRVNGFEFLEWLHHKSPDDLRVIPVVVMSSSNLPEDINRVYELGANSYMVKPVKWAEFQERVKALGFYWAENVETPFVHDPKIKPPESKSEE